MSSGSTARRRAAGLGERRGVLQPFQPDRAEVAGQRAQAVEPGARLVPAALVLDGEQRPLLAGKQRRHAGEAGEVGRRPQRLEVEQLDRRRAGLEDGDVGLQGGAQGDEGQRRPGARRRQQVERHLDLGEQRQRALGPGQQLAEVRLRLEQLTQVVAGRAAARLRGVLGDRPAIALADLRERRRRPGRPRPRQPARQIGAAALPEDQLPAAGEDGMHAPHLVLGLPVDDRP